MQEIYRDPVDVLTSITGDRIVAIALMECFGSVRRIREAPAAELAYTVKGVGLATAERVKAAFDLAALLYAEENPRPAIHAPADVANLVMFTMSSLEQEQFRVLLLDTRNRVLDQQVVYQGSINTALIRMAEVFKLAIRINAPALIAVHNHPSGDPSPGPDDIAFTRAMFKAGKSLDIELLDHIIIGHGRWVSLKERGLGFP